MKIANLLTVSVVGLMTSGLAFGGTVTFQDGGYTWTATEEDGGLTLTAASPELSGDVVLPLSGNGIEVKRVASSAFAGNRNLRALNIQGCVNIGESAFARCENLESLAVEGGEVNRHGFSSCSKLGDVFIGKAVAGLWYCSFADCASLTNVVFEEGSVTLFLQNPFERDSRLEKLHMPARFEGSWSTGAFAYCDALTNLTIDAGNPYCKVVNGIVISRDGKSVFAFAAGLSSFVFPNTVEVVEGRATDGCRKVTEFEFPDSLKVLDNQSIYYCEALESVKIGTGIESILSPRIGFPTFCGCPKLKSIYFAGNAPTNVEDLIYQDVPTDLVTYVKPGTTGWNKNGSMVLPELWPTNGVYGREIDYWPGTTTITYQVSFNIGTNGVRVGGGGLNQTVERKKAATAPVLAPHAGWVFAGWDRSFDRVVSDMTVNALWSKAIYIGPDTLPQAKEKVAYSVQLVATNGDEPYSWEAANGYAISRIRNGFSEIGTPMNWYGDDDEWTYGLPFAFPMGGETFDEVAIGDNGYVRIGENEIYAFDRDLYAYDDFNNLIGDIFIAENRDFVTVRWRRVEYGTSDFVNCSVTLYSDGRIRVCYGRIDVDEGYQFIVVNGEETWCEDGDVLGGNALSFIDDVEYRPVSLPRGLELTSEGEIVGTPTQAGTNEFVVSVSDANGNTTNKYYSLVVVENENRRPIVLSYSPELRFSTSVGSNVLFAVDAEDPEGGMLIYTWVLNDETVYCHTNGTYGCELLPEMHGVNRMKCIVSDGFWTNDVTVGWTFTASQEYILNADDNKNLSGFFNETEIMPGDVVKLCPGVYELADGAWFDNEIKIVGIEGAEKTSIYGSGNWFECDRTSGSRISGITLCDCPIGGFRAKRCRFTGFRSGTCAYNCELEACLAYGNRGYDVFEDSQLFNCTVCCNEVSDAALYSCSAYNSIVYGNTNGEEDRNFLIETYDDYAGGQQKWQSASFNNCCVSPLPEGGVGNIASDPLLVCARLGDLRLRQGSPCIGIGSIENVKDGCDYFGVAWGDQVNMGAVAGAGVSGYVVAVTVVGGGRVSPTVAVANSGETVRLTADTTLRPFIGWERNGSIVSTNGSYSVVVGSEDVALVARFGLCEWFVDVEIGSDENDGMTSETPKRSIQAAVEGAVDGETIHVATGTYVPFDARGKELIITCAGIDETVIDGESDTRCVTLGSGSGIGATLKNATLANGYSHNGGGVYGGTIENCAVRGCAAWKMGGGVASVLARRCFIEDNAIDPWGRGWMSAGAGAAGSTLENCLLRNNYVYATDQGQGGGAYNCQLYGCTVVENGVEGQYAYGGGVAFGIAYNTIVVDNWCDGWEWSDYDNVNSTELVACFVDDDPLFGDDYILTAESPCVDAGDDRYVRGECDLAGNVRMFSERTDIGAFECVDPKLNNKKPVVNNAEGMYAPSAAWAQVAPGESLDFAIMCSDPEGQPLTVEWVLDGEVIATDVEDDKFRPLGHTYSYLPEESNRGQHEMECRISDDCWTVVARRWTVYVGNQICVDASTPADYYEQDGLSWETAFGSIYQANENLLEGDVICVRPGVYNDYIESGHHGCKFLAVSTDGPEKTIIRGSAYAYDGESAETSRERSKFMGFTFRGEDEYTVGYATLENCIVDGLADVHECSVNHCTIYNVSSFYASEGELKDCIVRNCPNMDNVPFADPLFVDASNGDFRLRVNSPCLNAASDGTNLGALQGEGVDGNVVSAQIRGRGALSFTTAVVTNGTTVTISVEESPRSLVRFETNGVYATSERTLVIHNVTSDVTVTAVFASYAFCVDAEHGDDRSDGLSWGTAKRTIQAALNESYDYDSICVAPGCYEPILSESKLVRIESLCGADCTVIDGGGTNRCANLGLDENGRNMYRENSRTNTAIVGFTLRNGFNSAASWGGAGVFCGTAVNCVISNCVAQCRDWMCGGGASRAELYNCVVVSNYTHSSDYLVEGGGVSGGSLHNCTVVGNVSYSGSGAISGLGVGYGVVYNSVVCDNFCLSEGGDSAVQIYNGYYVGSDGNITENPGFVDAAHGDFRLQAGSAAIDAGNNFYVSTECDILGNQRIWGSVVDVGAYEYGSSRPQGTVCKVVFCAGKHGSIAPSNEVCEVTLGGSVVPPTVTQERGWRFVAWNGVYENVTGNSYVVAQYEVDETDVDYQVVFDAGEHGVLTGAVGSVQTIRYGEPAVPPFVIPNEGWYFAGWNVDYSTIISNTTVLANYLGLEVGTSPSNLTMTAYVGEPVRFAVTLGEGSSHDTVMWTLDGSNVLSGASREYVFTPAMAQESRTISCKVVNEHWERVVATWTVNCVRRIYVDVASTNNAPTGVDLGSAYRDITSAFLSAGSGDEILVAPGIYPPVEAYDDSDPGKLVTIRSMEGFASTFIVAPTNGAYYGYGCVMGSGYGPEQLVVDGFTIKGGGVYYATLLNCQITDNFSMMGYGPGGISVGGIFKNCLIFGNTISYPMESCTFFNCTITGNEVYVPEEEYYYYAPAAVLGYDCHVYNSIVYGNVDSTGSQYNFPDEEMWGDCATMVNCCTYPLPGTGENNITNDPVFADSAFGDYHLYIGSPCLESGNNAYVDTEVDLDGNPRIRGVVDLGAYEGAVSLDVPNAPDNLIAEDGVAAYGIGISWLPTPRAQEYIVYRSPTGGTNDMVVVGRTKGTFFEDSTAEEQKVYWYRVAAANNAGSSVWSQADSGWRVEPLVILNDRLPPAVENVEYETTLCATGGVPPYVWSVSDTMEYVVSREDNSFSSVSGSSVGASSDDTCAAYDLPFDFPFFGNVYRRIWISSNGTIAFDGSFSEYSVNAHTFSNRVMIAGMWRDLNMSSGGVYASKTANELTLRWSGTYYSGPAVNFTVKLGVDGQIRVSYGSGNANGGVYGVSAGDGEHCIFVNVGTSLSLAEDVVISPSGCPDGIELSTGGVLRGKPVESGLNHLFVTVSDRMSNSVSKVLTMLVDTNSNVRPVISSWSPSQQDVVVWPGRTAEFGVEAFDWNNDALEYVWSLDGIVCQTNATGRFVLPVPTETGTEHTLVCRVSDGFWAEGIEHSWNVRTPDLYVNAATGSDTNSGARASAPLATIQKAVSVATAGARISVAPGVYGYVSTGNKALDVVGYGIGRSIIDGGGTGRCVYVNGSGTYTNSVFESFTIRNGVVNGNGAGVSCGMYIDCLIENCRATGSYYGGGAYYANLVNCRVEDCSAYGGGGTAYGWNNGCVIRGNSASYYGGGIYYGTHNYTTIAENKASYGGGSYYGSLNYCTMTRNRTDYGGAAYNSTLTRSILWGNSFTDGLTCDGWYNATFTYSCVETGASGTGNIKVDPLLCELPDGHFGIFSVSPAIGMGAKPNGCTGLYLHTKAVGPGYVSTSRIATNNESVVVVATQPDALHRFAGFSMNGEPVMGGVTSEGLNHTLGIASMTGSVDVVAEFVPVTFYVSPNGTNGADGVSWASAKKTIQGAIDCALSYDTIVVTNGVYSPIAVSRHSYVRIKSVEGASNTIIDGGANSRCATLGLWSLHHDWSLDGFTLRNGSVLGYGGGAYAGVLKNCILTGNTSRWNSSNNYGGGAAAYAWIYDCEITGNNGYYGGGTYYGWTTNSIIEANSATIGGGAYYGDVLGSRIEGNAASSSGGGSYYSNLTFCELGG